MTALPEIARGRSLGLLNYPITKLQNYKFLTGLPETHTAQSLPQSLLGPASAVPLGTTFPVQWTRMLSVRVISGGSVSVNSMGEPSEIVLSTIERNTTCANVARLGFLLFSLRKLNSEWKPKGKAPRCALFALRFGHEHFLHWTVSISPGHLGCQQITEMFGRKIPFFL